MSILIMSFRLCQSASDPLSTRPVVNRVKKRLLGTPSQGGETGKLISFVERGAVQGVGSIASVEGQWERIPVKIDSGAIDTVMPPKVANRFKLIETDMSRHGPGFKAANGSAIKHFGQRVVKGISDAYRPLTMTAQVADVKTTLASVYQIVRAGNSVHFERGNCYMENARTGKKD